MHDVSLQALKNQAFLSVKINADHLNKKMSLFCCAIFLILTGIISTIILSLGKKDIFVTLAPSKQCGKIPYNKGLFCDKFAFNQIYIKEAFFMNNDHFNQYLSIEAIPLALKDSEAQNVSFKSHMLVSAAIERVREDFFAVQGKAFHESVNHTFECQMDKLKPNHQGVVECSSFTLMRLPDIDPGHYKIRFAIMNQGSLFPDIIGLRLKASQIDASYYESYLTFRYLLVFLSFFSMLIYFCQYFKCPRTLRTFEQDYIALLSAGLVLFNDPQIYLNIASPSKFSTFFSISLTSGFSGLLLCFWLIMVRRIHDENLTRRSKHANWKVFLVFAISTLFFCVAMCSVAWLFVKTPWQTVESYPTAYKVCIAIGIIITVFTLGATLWYLYLCFRRFNEKLYRHKIFLGFTLSFMLIIQFMILSTVFKYYSTGLAAKVGIMLVNMYVLLLQFLYSTSKTGFKNIEELKEKARAQKAVDSKYLEIAQPNLDDLYSGRPLADPYSGRTSALGESDNKNKDKSPSPHDPQPSRIPLKGGPEADKVEYPLEQKKADDTLGEDDFDEDKFDI